jgi:hypothetical protein
MLRLLWLEPKLPPILVGMLVALAPAGASQRRVPVPAAEPAPAAKVATPRPVAGGTADLRGRYAEVITPAASTLPGLFTVHRVGNQVYYEIPGSALGREMLWYTELAQAPVGVDASASPVGMRVVRWERHYNRVFLRDLYYSKRALGREEKVEPQRSAGVTVSDSVGRIVEEASLAPIIMAFDVEAEGPNGEAVIDVSPLLETEVPEFSPRQVLEDSGPPLGPVDPNRCAIESVAAYPANIETRSLLTFPLRRGRSNAGDSDPDELRTVSVLVRYSMTTLPDRPMRPRYADPRVGYFSEEFEDYSSPEKGIVGREIIQRCRLEKKDPAAAISEPVKPILFYLGREVPEKWRPYLKQGVEEWNVAFEGAGFRNAIQCRPAPTPQEDPGWSPEDARYSVIRWSAQSGRNAMSTSLDDPRTGEILSSRVVIWADLLKFAQIWYLIQCAAVDPGARRFPLSEAQIGSLLRYIVAHEVGHCLGLTHNNRASSAFTVQQLRNPAFTDRYGTVASIMSYGRFNYVAQPGDGVRRLLPKLGPYDRFAIQWGYQPIPEAASPGEEKPILERWASREATEPWLRYSGERLTSLTDPMVKTENIGSDPILATQLGLRNLDRVVQYLLPIVDGSEAPDKLMPELYSRVLQQRYEWFSSVMKMVGGTVEVASPAGRGGGRFAKVSPARQRQAVRFLAQYAFKTPVNLLQPALLSRLPGPGAANQVRHQQCELLEDLMSPQRYQQLADAEGLGSTPAYGMHEFLCDVQDGVWSELTAPHPSIGRARRELQRAYLALLRSQLQAPTKPDEADGDSESMADDDETEPSSSDRLPSDFPAVAHLTLERLADQIGPSIRKAADSMTRAHLQQCWKELSRMLSD